MSSAIIDIALHMTDALETEEVVTDEQRAEMKRDIIEKMMGIQELITTYRKQQEQLQEDIVGFVEREVVEENKMHEIAASVEKDQQAALRNPSYVRWAATNGKGEFASNELAPPNGVSKSAMRETSIQSEVTTGTDWMELMPSSVTTYSRAVALDGYPGVKQHLAGWRRLNSAISAQLTGLAADLVETNGQRADEPLVVFVNGLPVLHRSLLDTETAQSSLIDAANGNVSIAEVVLRWQHQVLSASAVVTVSACAELFSMSPSLSKALVEDSDDVCGVLPLSCVERAVMLRMYLVDCSLRIIEVCDPKCDTSSELLKSHLGSDPSSQDVDDCIVAVCMNFVDEYTSLAPHGRSNREVVSAFLVAQRPPAAPKLIVVDVKGLSPGVNFQWHLSWSDVCGLGRQDNSGAPVVVKRTRARIAELEAFDPLTEVWFPVLNKALLSHRSDTTARSSPSSWNGGSKVPLLGVAVAATAAAAASAALTFWLSRRR